MGVVMRNMASIMLRMVMMTNHMTHLLAVMWPTPMVRQARLVLRTTNPGMLCVPRSAGRYRGSGHNHGWG